MATYKDTKWQDRDVSAGPAGDRVYVDAYAPGASITLNLTPDDARSLASDLMSAASQAAQR